MIETILFWGLAVIAITSALSVIALRNPADSVMALLVTMMAVAGLFALMGAYALALFQLIVYIGAILVLFVFVVMLLNLKNIIPARIPKLTAIAGIALAVGVAYFLWQTFMNGSQPVSMTLHGISAEVSVREIALELFSRHILVFELTSVLLLAAAIGAVYITRKERDHS